MQNLLSLSARPLGLALSLALAFALAPLHAAHAQSDAANPQATPEYRQLVEQALAEFEHGNWDEAEGLFQQAHRIYPNARTLRGMGVAAFEGRRYVVALEHLRAALISQVNPLTAEQRSSVESAVARAERYIGTVELVVEPADADVRVNGAPVVANAEGKRVASLDPGPVEVRVSAPGYEPTTRPLRIVSGAHERVEIRLSPIAVTTAGPGGATGGSSRKASGGPSFTVWKWVALGLGAASLTVGIVSHLEREDIADQYNNDPACEGEQDEDEARICNGYRDDFDSANVRTVIGYAAGGAFTGTAILLFVLDANADDGDSESARSGCGIGLGQAGCTLHF